MKRGKEPMPTDGWGADDPVNRIVASDGRRSGLVPFVVVNMAMTADGKIATAGRQVSSFGSAEDLEHLYELRATADAVMAGARTVEAGAITLGPGPARFREARRRAGLRENNLRVIVSGRGTVSLGAAIFRHRFSPILILTTGRMSQARRRELEKVAVIQECGSHVLDLGFAMRWLRREWGVKRLVCEGGGELNAAMMRSGLVEEFHLTVCPWIVGGAMAPTLAGGTRIHGGLEAARPYQLRSIRSSRDEVFLVFRKA